VVHDVDRLVDLQVEGHVVVDERERVPAEVLDVLERAGLEAVHADHPLALGEQVVAEVRAEESGASRDHRRRHRGGAIAAR
jgi:hypothetical protein